MKCKLTLVCIFVTSLLLLAPTNSFEQAQAAAGIQAAGRPISAIQIRGLRTTPKRLVENQIRSETGKPYNPETVEHDIVRITHLGRFSKVSASVQSLVDGSVVLTFHLTEQQLISKIKITGNKAISTDTLLRRISLMPGDPASSFLIDRAKKRIVDAYKNKGYFIVAVSIDKDALKNKGVLKLIVDEGPNVRIAAIRYKGNKAFSDGELSSRIKSHTYFPILHSGNLSRKQLELDAAALRDYYHDHGYLDAQVGRKIELSPNQHNATVTFLINEGKRYTIASIRTQGVKIFPKKQIRQVMNIKPGDFYSNKAISKARQSLLNMYGKIGYINTQVSIKHIFHENSSTVDLLIDVTEGTRSIVGKITIRGNDNTEKRVILRQIRGMQPGKPFDRQGISQTRHRLSESYLFSKADVTILGKPDDKVKDVLINVKERHTGSLSFGAGISSDSGVIGAINLVQRNFDIGDFPTSLKDFFSGDAFRGAGQYFSLSLQPGTRTSQYSVSFRDPHVFQSDYFLDTSAFYYKREQLKHDEQRIGANIGIGHRFGDVWSGSLTFRGQQVNIDHIDNDAPIDVYDVAGKSIVTGVGLSMTRDTTDSAIMPSQGSRLTFSIEQVGALGGDYNFTKASAQFQKFWTISEDYLGRKSIFSFRGQVGYILQDNSAPVFERFFAGGRSFRGFDYRGAGPRGIRHDNGQRSDEARGGRFMLLTGLQYEFPLVSNVLRGVIFTDQGTVDTTASVDHWRVSIGTGLRIKLPFFGRAPFAIDVAIPIIDEPGDQHRLVSFDLALPFR